MNGLHPQLVGEVASLGWVALKAGLLFVTAVVGFRLSGRRVLAEMAIIDFVAAVAVGAIVGRVPNASTTSYLQGAVTLVVVLVLHNVVTRLRFVPGVSRLVDHRPRLLMEGGEVRTRELRRCGLTDGDFRALLRQHGVTDLAQVRYVIFEQRGAVSVVRHGADDGEASGTSVVEEDLPALHRPGASS